MNCVAPVLEDDPIVRMGAVALSFTNVDMPKTIGGVKPAGLDGRWPAIRSIVTSGRIVVPDEETPDDGCFIGKPYCAGNIGAGIRKAPAQTKSLKLR